MVRLIPVFLLFLFLAACAVPASGDDVIDAPSSEGSALLAEATRAAVRAISERKTATLQAATISAGATRDFVARAATGTAEALRVRAQEMNLNATAQALAAQAQQTRDAGTATARADNIAQSQTAQAQLDARNATRTAAAQQATETTSAATATRGAQKIQAALEQRQATATAQALQIAIADAQTNAARAQAWNDFLDSLLKIIVAVGSVALIIMLIIQVARYLDTLAMRQRLVETRSGTVLIVATRNGVAAEIIKPTPNLLDAGDAALDAFEHTQLPTVAHEADELLKITTARGETFIARDDPAQVAQDAQRKLAMRLLRESINYHARHHTAPDAQNRIPSFRDLRWSSETWVRAVNTLRPHIETKQGRGGGTYCVEPFRSVHQLYAAVGERRVQVGQMPPSPPSPSPTLAAAAASG